MTYETIAVKEEAITQFLSKLKEARLIVEEEQQRLKALDTSGEGLTAREHQKIDALISIAGLLGSIMDMVMICIWDALQAYIHTDSTLSQKIAQALFSR